MEAKRRQCFRQEGVVSSVKCCRGVEKDKDQTVFLILNGTEVTGDIGEKLISQKTACREEVGEETEGEGVSNSVKKLHGGERG